MSDSTELRWGPFCLFGRYGPLTRDGKTVKLQSKTLAVLWTLAKQPGEVVNKSDLINAVWPGSQVAEEALTFQVQLLRRALGDTGRELRYIQTVHRVGFRLRAGDASSTAKTQVPFVGRSTELNLLLQHLQHAETGQRQFVFISGEAGIGKTALIRQFINNQNIAADLIVATGQCTEYGGISEAFLPMLQAIQQIVRQSPDDRVFQLLRQIAPSWLVQMPALLEPAEFALLTSQTKGTPQTRMLREMTEFLEAFTAERTLVLILEDLHWSDSATLELLTRLVPQTEKARLVVLCTLRPADAIATSHPVRQLQLTLRGRKIASDLMLSHLTATDIERYVHQQLGPTLASDALVEQITQRSGGHPLFMVQIADYLRHDTDSSQKSALALSTTVPPALRDLIELQLSKLEPTQQALLEIASLTGFEFAAVSVATVTGESIEVVDRQLEQLVKQEQFIVDSGLAIWPDGTVSGRYRFRHALHQITLRERLPSARQARTHRIIAERLEAGYGARNAEVVTELILHFEQAGLHLKAATYCMLSARTSLQRSAPAEVLAQAHHGLRLLQGHTTADTRSLELALHTFAAAALQGQHSNVTTNAQSHLEKIEALLDETHAPALLESAMATLWMSTQMAARFEEALKHASRMQQLGIELDQPLLQCVGLAWAAYSALNLGSFTQALHDSEQAVQIINNVTTIPQSNASSAYGSNALALWQMGFPDQALKRTQQAMHFLQYFGNPYNESLARSAVWINLLIFRRDYATAVEICASAVLQCERLGAKDALQWTSVQHGITRCFTEGGDDALNALRKALKTQSASGTLLNLPIGYLHDAEYCLHLQRTAEARAAIDQALRLIRLGVGMLESEALRLDGECLLQEHPKQPGRAEKRLRQALDFAHERGALSLELRAATSLARFWHSRNQTADAYALLNGVYERFTEGFSTRDLTDARTLLDEWASVQTPASDKQKL